MRGFVTRAVKSSAVPNRCRVGFAPPFLSRSGSGLGLIRKAARRRIKTDFSGEMICNSVSLPLYLLFFRRMQAAVVPSASEKRRLYDLCLRQIEDTLLDETDATAVLASVVCILKQNLRYASWVGFYRLDPSLPGELVVGPYQGTFGCLRIPVGRGVCGACAETRRAVIVPDVREFEGHIACDAAARSEIVVPLFDCDRQLYAVLDLDSELLDAFSAEDQVGLERILEFISVKF